MVLPYINMNLPQVYTCSPSPLLLSCFNSTGTMNFQMFKLDLKKAKPRDQIANIHWIIEKAREFQKNIYFCFIDYAKAFDCVDHNKLENSERDGNTRPPDLSLEKPVQVGKQ